MINPKYADLTSFPSACFTFQDALRAQGLEPLISSSGNYYPGLVRMFYINLTSDGKILYTVINGRKINLPSKLLSELFGLPTSGCTLYDPDNKAWEDFNKRRFYLSMARIPPQEAHARRVRLHCGNIPERDSWMASIFNIDDRLFHYFLVYVLFPRAGNHCTVTDLELQVMYVVKKGIPLHWGKLIAIHMGTFDNKSKYLPYGRIITHILEHYETNFFGL